VIEIEIEIGIETRIGDRDSDSYRADTFILHMTYYSIIYTYSYNHHLSLLPFHKLI
jgi:hypothetical protein